MASSLIGSLRVALGLDTADFESGAAKAKQRAKQVSNEMAGSFNSAKKAVQGLFAAFTVGLLTEQIKRSLEYAGSLAEVGQQLGVTTKDLQTFRFAAGQVGVSQDQLETGLSKLTITLGKIAAGAKAPTQALNAIGISAEQLKGKTTGDAFRVIADGLQKVSDRSQRAAVEVGLFGKSGASLDNLLSGGSQALNELSAAAERLGIVLSDEQIRHADETADKLRAVKEVLSAQIASIVADNASAILSLSSALATLTAQIIKFLGSNPQLALGIIGALLGGRVGGLPGAVIGGAAGALLGGKIAQSAADSNTDVGFRAQQFLAARQAFLSAQSRGAGPAISVGGIQTGGGAPDTRALRSEYVRQAQLYQQAKALANAPKPAALGVDIPKFLAGADKQPKKSPKDLNEDVLFQLSQEQTQADEAIIQAQEELEHNITKRADLALQLLDLETQARDAEIEHRVAKARQDFAEGKITQATLDEMVSQEGILKSKNDRAASLRRTAILDDRDRALIEQQTSIDQHYFSLKEDELRKQADLATTAEERRKIELQILDLTYQAKKQALDRIIETSKDDAEIANARADLANLNKNHALDRAGVLRQTQNPLEQWAQSIPKTAAEINEALQSIEAHGLDGLSDAIADVIGGTRSLKEAFGDLAKSVVADILKMTVKMLVFRAISSIFGGGSISAPNTSANVPFLNLGSATPLPSVAPGFASGGSFTVLGRGGVDRNLLSLNGLPIARVSHGERVSIANDNVSSGGRPYFDLRGAVMTQDLLQQMNQIGQVSTGRGALLGAAGAEERSARRARRTIP